MYPTKPRKPSDFIKARNSGKPYLVQAYETAPALQILDLIMDIENVTKTCDVPLGTFIFIVDKPIFEPEPSYVVFQGFKVKYES